MEFEVHDILEILDEHRKKCQKEGDYVEAEIANNRIEELKLHEESRRREALRSRQLDERVQKNTKMLRSFKDFTDKWETEMAKFERKAEGMVKEVLERQAKAYQDYLAELLVSKKTVLHTSSIDLLNLRKIEQTLANNKQYAEAHKLKLRADEMEKWEKGQWMTTWENEVVQKEAAFKDSQAAELIALQKRIQIRREELKVRRHNELDVMLKRCQNSRAELESKHCLERANMEKLVLSGALNAVTGAAEMEAAAAASKNK